MRTVEIKYHRQTFTAKPFDLPWGGEETDRAVEDATARLLDEIDARAAVLCGAQPPHYATTRAFKLRMERARSELERSELETLKMLLETYHLA
jgi:hypothetical protein